MIGRAIVAGQRINGPTVESCYTINEREERCFKALRSERLMTWPAARDWCYSQSDGYSLATVRDDATQLALTSFLYDHELTTRNVWIGARQNVNSGWKWIDGTNESSELYHVLHR